MGFKSDLPLKKVFSIRSFYNQNRQNQSSISPEVPHLKIGGGPSSGGDCFLSWTTTEARVTCLDVVTSHEETLLRAGESHSSCSGPQRWLLKKRCFSGGF